MERDESKTEVAGGMSAVDPLVMRLRNRFQIPDGLATDEDVLRMTNGSLGRALVELDIASDEWGGVLREEINQTRNQINSGIEKYLRWLHDA